MAHDDSIMSYKVREVVSSFGTAEQFENAVDALEHAGFSRDAIHMWASHDAVEGKLGHFYVRTGEVTEDKPGPQAIYDDRKDVRGEKGLAIGIPTYIGGAGAGLAILATGGTLAFGALAVAGAMATGVGIGAVIARMLGERHAEFLERQLAMGSLLIWVDVSGAGRETTAIHILKTAGGKDIHAHSLTRYRLFDESPIAYSNPSDFMGYPGSF